MTPCVLITGASFGTGYAIAERFSKEGYAVFIGGRGKEYGEDVDTAAKQLQEAYGCFAKGVLYHTDCICEQEIDALFEQIKAEGYPLKACVFNAAHLGRGQESLSVKFDDFMQVIQTNIGFNFLIAQHAAGQMKQHGGGSFVFIGSNSALRVTENRCAYCSSKSAMLAMSKSFAVDWGQYGIRSNVILPGMIKTKRWQENENGIQNLLANRTPIGDIAEFEDIANAAYFLCSEQARCITGTELTVDGGMLAQLTPKAE